MLILNVTVIEFLKFPSVLTQKSLQGKYSSKFFLVLPYWQTFYNSNISGLYNFVIKIKGK